MTHSHRNLAAVGRFHSERGIVLLVSLVVLLVMTLTSLALVRTTTTGSSIAGSLALKQTATTGADLGLEQGLAQLDVLSQMGNLLDFGDARHAYYYTHLDPRTAAKDLVWRSARQVTADDGLGNQVHYMIHRLCSKAGPWNADGQSCVSPHTSGCPGSSDSPGVVPCNDRPMYRISARALGPRNTVSYVQMTVF